MDNRLIKFRVWDKNFKQMTPVAKIDYGDDGDMEPFIVVTAPPGDECTTLEHGIGGFLMQFTGITDKNDVPIYEGDILGLDDPDDQSRAVIVFRNAAFRAELVGAPYIDDPHWTTIDSAWVVIGNRWEHPELLRGKQP